MNNQEYDYLNNNAIEVFISEIKKIKTKISQIKNLPLYEKVRIISSLFMTFFMKKENFKLGNEILQLNLRYLIVNEKENNSIIDRCCYFYNNFVNSMTEDSPIFPYLLNITSWCWFYNKEKVYAFDLGDVGVMKSRLKQMFPEVIIFCCVVNES